MVKSRSRATPRQDKSDPAYRYAPDTAETSREELIDAWFRAKAANPKITQREFEVKAMGRDPDKADGRYLRLVLEGKRSGRIIVREAYETPTGGVANVFNVRMEDDKGEWHSFNIHPQRQGFLSRLDVPVVEQQVRANPAILQAKADEWARRYSTKVHTGRFEVTRVVNQRARGTIIPRS